MTSPRDKTDIVKSPQTLAAELHFLQENRKALEEREEEVKTLLLEELRRQGVRRVDLIDGKCYIRVKKVTIGVKRGHEEEAFKWAEHRRALKVDTALVKDILTLERMLDKPPAGFKRVESEHLRISDGKETQE